VSDIHSYNVCKSGLTVIVLVGRRSNPNPSPSSFSVLMMWQVLGSIRDQMSESDQLEIAMEFMFTGASRYIRVTALDRPSSNANSQILTHFQPVSVCVSVLPAVSHPVSSGWFTT